MEQQFEKKGWYKRIEKPDFTWGDNYVLYINVYDYKPNTDNPIRDCESIMYNGRYYKEQSQRSGKGWQLLTDLSEIAQYLPQNHPDLQQNSLISLEIW